MTVATADEDDDADNCGSDDTEKDAVDDDDGGEEEEGENTDKDAGDEPDGEDLTTLPLGTELASNNLTMMKKMIINDKNDHS